MERYLTVARRRVPVGVRTLTPLLITRFELISFNLCVKKFNLEQGVGILKNNYKSDWKISHFGKLCLPFFKFIISPVINPISDRLDIYAKCRQVATSALTTLDGKSEEE